MKVIILHRALPFTFDTNNNIFCNSLNIKWYQDDVLLKDDDENDLDIDFTPNSAFYFCRKQVQYYNKVVITFNSLNMPTTALNCVLLTMAMVHISMVMNCGNVKAYTRD